MKAVNPSLTWRLGQSSDSTISSGFKQRPAFDRSGPTLPPCSAGLVAREAGELRRSEQLCSPCDVAGIACVMEQVCYEGRVIGRGEIRGGFPGVGSNRPVGEPGGWLGGISRRRWDRCARLWPRPGRLALELGHQPIETVQVIAQPLFGVVLGMAQNADRALVAAGTDGPQQFEVQGTLAQRQDLPAMTVAVLFHPVQAHGTQVRQHFAEQWAKTVKVIVAVMKVVDDSDVFDFLALQSLDNRNLVLGLAEPAAVVVERQRAADLGGLVGQRAELFRGGGDPPLLLGSGCAIGTEVEKHPEAGLQAVAFEQVEDDARLAIELAGSDPEGIEPDALSCQGIHLGVEAGDVFRSPVVGESLEPEPLEHGRAIFRAAVLTVERNDAPGHQVVTGEQVPGGFGDLLFGWLSAGGRASVPNLAERDACAAWPKSARLAMIATRIHERARLPNDCIDNAFFD